MANVFSNRSQEQQWAQQLKWFNPMKLPQSTYVKITWFDWIDDLPLFFVNWLFNSINLDNFWLELNYVMKWKILLVLIWEENDIEMPSPDWCVQINHKIMIGHITSKWVNIKFNQYYRVYTLIKSVQHRSWTLHNGTHGYINCTSNTPRRITWVWKQETCKKNKSKWTWA